MKNYVLYVLLALGISFASCSKPTYHQLSDSDLLWLMYTDATELYFQNTSGNIDTFNIEAKFRGYQHSGDVYDEEAGFTVTQENDTLPTGREGKIRVSLTDAGLIVEVSFPHHPVVSYPLSMTPLATDTIMGNVFENVYVSTAPLGTTSINKPIKQIKFSKAFGFIEFTDINGEIWYRVF